MSFYNESKTFFLKREGLWAGNVVSIVKKEYGSLELFL